MADRGPPTCFVRILSIITYKKMQKKTYVPVVVKSYVDTFVHYLHLCAINSVVIK